MAQEQVYTLEAVAETAKLVAGEAASKMEQVVAIKTACSAATASGYSDYTQATESGLTKVTAGTLSSSSDSAANDTAIQVHPFTAGESATVKGHMTVNTENDVCYVVCCYAADVVMETSDTLTVTTKARFKNG